MLGTEGNWLSLSNHFFVGKIMSLLENCNVYGSLALGGMRIGDKPLFRKYGRIVVYRGIVLYIKTLFEAHKHHSEWKASK